MSKISAEALLGAITKAQEGFVFEKSNQEIFNYLLDSLLEVTGSEYGFIGEVLLKDGKPYLKTHAITNIAWNDDTRNFYEQNAPKGLEFFNLNSLFGQVMVTEKPVIANDPYNDPRRTGLPEGHPHMGSFLGIPFFFNGKINGMVGIANRKEGYDEAIVNELQPLLVTCASLIEGFRNANKKKEFERDLKTSVRQLKESNEELNRFAHITSHDLKSPLRGISSLVDYITDDLEEFDLPEEVTENFKMIKSRINLLYNLIEDIIAYSQAGTGTEKESIKLKPFVEQLLKNSNTYEKEIETSTSIGEEIIDCNKSQLYQLIYNLTDNAIKYNDKDVVKVKVSTNIENGILNIDIEDNGPGIPEKFRSKIFELFQTLNERKREDSTGIGLSIVNKIISKNNGSISITESEELGGSKFSIQFSV